MKYLIIIAYAWYVRLSQCIRFPWSTNFLRYIYIYLQYYTYIRCVYRYSLYGDPNTYIYIRFHEVPIQSLCVYIYIYMVTPCYTNILDSYEVPNHYIYIYIYIQCIYTYIYSTYGYLNLICIYIHIFRICIAWPLRITAEMVCPACSQLFWRLGQNAYICMYIYITVINHH